MLFSGEQRFKAYLKPPQKHSRMVNHSHQYLTDGFVQKMLVINLFSDSRTSRDTVINMDLSICVATHGLQRISLIKIYISSLSLLLSPTHVYQDPHFASFSHRIPALGSRFKQSSRSRMMYSNSLVLPGDP